MGDFLVTLEGDAPPRRFLTPLAAAGGTAVMRLADAGEIPVGTTSASMADGAHFRFVVAGRPVWLVEAGEDIEPGAFIAAGPDGRAINAAEGDPYAVAMALDAGTGPTTSPAAPGSTIRVAPLRTVGLGGGGGDGTVAWADVTGKPSTYPPVTGTSATSAKPGNWQPASANISDATDTGRAVLTAADQAAARTAIGAGTSSLAIGTTASTAAAGNHTHTATQVTATAIGPGTATTVQGVLGELAARIAALESA
ncbi:hypothetical protein [Streptomyces harbinensis]|uniref:hypothetical protein n=1 Tax=Streptomyces harbinensis TaxID=1176198 RepID=UPI0036753F29